MESAHTPKKTPWALIISIILGVIALIIIVGFVFVTAIMGMLKGNGAYKAALAQAQSNPQLEQAIGSPMEPGRFVSGSIQTSGPNGTAALSFKLTGPDGVANVNTEATKRLGEWETDALIAHVKDGERIVIVPDDRLTN